ncbi:alpha/beta hydrolase [Achromobacter xylosoxidans]
MTAGVSAADLQVHHRFEQVGDVKVFYREAGPRDAPIVLLLHGYAASSFMYRNLIPLLADGYRVIAPDLPGFGFTEAPARGQYDYTFDQLAKTIGQFTRQLGLDRYAMQVFDYGAPVGWRLAAEHPARISAIISQNGNAYEEGLGAGWAPIQKYWKNPSQANRDALREFATPASIRWQYLEGVPDQTLVAPDAIALESHLVSRPAMPTSSSTCCWTTPPTSRSIRSSRRTSASTSRRCWPCGARTILFLPAGAEAWKRDIPGADVRFYDTGHLALETHGAEIGAVIRRFLDKNAK